MNTRKYINLYIFIILALAAGSCTKGLDLQPRNKIPGDVVLSDPNGIRAFVADLYYQSPIEDFTYFPREGFNARGNTGSMSLSQYGLEAIHSEWPNFNEFNNGWWGSAYRLNRNINVLIEAIPDLDIAESEKKMLLGEAHFLRAYAYFALAKRYGGVSIITSNQAYTSEFESLRVPRSTEKETWDFVLAECDKAIENLPETRQSADETKRRATKWAAYALKSRAALFAASVAKFWNKAPLSGEAVDKKLVGLDLADANGYYQQCIEASDAIISSGKFSLYGANPGNVQNAINNLRSLFTDPNVAPQEVIFLKGYGKIGEPLAHDYDGWNNPNQNQEGFPYRGRTNPILELVDTYESYTNPGVSSPVVTRTDGNVNDYGGYNQNVSYLRFNTPDEIFKDKDARFFSTVIYPNAIWKSTQIIIQGGVVRPDGTLMDARGSYTHNGVTYYTYGREFQNQYSGYDGSANMTRSGFLLRKFLNESWRITNFGQSTTDFADMRYAEILLNYAEAVVESGAAQNNAQEKAKKAINDVRFRAGHTVEIPLTLANVLRERRVELAFENKEYWDLKRRRDYHIIFNNKLKTALVPMMDLRGATPQYIFVRKYVPGDRHRTVDIRDYYFPIPGIANNGLIQNPQY